MHHIWQNFFLSDYGTICQISFGINNQSDRKFISRFFKNRICLRNRGSVSFFIFFLPVNEGVDALLHHLGVRPEEGQLGEDLGRQLLVGQDLIGREGGLGFRRKDEVKGSECEIRKKKK
jgi:hypothetical protein